MTIDTLALVVSSLLAATAPSSAHVALPVPNYAGCTAGLPEKLRLTDSTRSSFAGLFAPEWAERVKAARKDKAKLSKERVCSLEHEVKRLDLPIVEAQMAQATLTCDGNQIRGAGVGRSAAEADQMLAFTLAHIAATALCDPEAYVAQLRQAEKQQARRAQARQSCPEGLDVETANEGDVSDFRFAWLGKTHGSGRGKALHCTFARGTKRKGRLAVVDGKLTCGERVWEASAAGKEEKQAVHEVINSLAEQVGNAACGDPLACDAMPKALKVEGPLSRALGRRAAWSAGDAEPLSCAVRSSSGKHPRLKAWTLSSGELRCGGKIFRAVGLAGDRATAETALVDVLVNALRDARCPLK